MGNNDMSTAALTALSLLPALLAYAAPQLEPEIIVPCELDKAHASDLSASITRNKLERYEQHYLRTIVSQLDGSGVLRGFQEVARRTPEAC